MIECQYVDFKTVEDPHLLAKISDELPSGTNNVLNTCHRVEYYGEAEGKKPDLFNNPSLGVKTIKPLPQVVERLVSLAAGVESEISAEWAIEEQVSAFVQKLASGDKMRDLGEVALALARSLRTEFGFYGPDHAGLALGEVRKFTKSRILLVFGAGMIGKNLAKTHKDLGYSEMILVTRNRKKAKKRIKEMDPTRIVSLESLSAGIFDPKQHDILIASTDIHPDYGEKIKRYISQNPAKAVVDVSAQPVMKETDGAITLRAKSMAEFIASHNEPLEPKRALIKGKIEDLAPRTADDLMQKWAY